MRRKAWWPDRYVGGLGREGGGESRVREKERERASAYAMPEAEALESYYSKKDEMQRGRDCECRRPRASLR